MKYSTLVKRIAPHADAEGDPWEVHDLAIERQAAGHDIAILSIGQEADERTPDLIVDAAINSLQAGDHHYTDVRGTPELRDAIAQYHQALTKQAVSRSNCTATIGAQNALFSVAQVLLEAGDEVIVSDPYYTTYAATFSASGATVTSIQVAAHNNYKIAITDLENAINSRTQAIVLNSPNNPMGTCYSLAEYEAIVALCIQHQIWLILDSVYLDIVDPASIALPHSFPGADDILITIGSLSKSHRMTGWRIGWAVAPAALTAHLSNLSMCMHYGLPAFVLKAAIAALKQSTATPGVVRDLLQRRRQIATPILSTISVVNFIDSGQGMFMLLDVSPLAISARDFGLYLLNNHNVSVLPCDGFGKAGKQLVRIGLCVDDEKLEQACYKIVQCVNELAA